MACRPLEILAVMQATIGAEGLHLQYHHKLFLRRGGPDGMRPLALLAEMQVKYWNRDVISYSGTISLLSRGPNGMSPWRFWQRCRARIGARQSSLTVPP